MTTGIKVGDRIKFKSATRDSYRVEPESCAVSTAKAARSWAMLAGGISSCMATRLSRF